MKSFSFCHVLSASEVQLHCTIGLVSSQSGAACVYVWTYEVCPLDMKFASKTVFNFHIVLGMSSWFD